MSGWQPIETAPRRERGLGPEILITQALGIGGLWITTVARFVGDDRIVNAWDHQPITEGQMEPTHWQPLPEPPEGT